jgi:sugar phosphate permease
MTIAALMGVEAADAGVASGLLNTSQQIGGAIGLAAASTIATTFTTRYVDAHPGSSPLSAAALTHGFDAAFYALTALAALAAVLGAVLLESHPVAPAEEAEFNAVPIEEAA